MDLFIGTTLSEARKQKKLSLKKISQDIKISSRYLQALEEENFEVFPAAVYLKGFLRTYGQYLQLDGEELVRTYERQHGQSSQQEIEQSTASAGIISSLNPRIMALILLSLVLVTLIIILLLRIR